MQNVDTNFARVTSASFLEYSEACWAEISDADYAHATAPLYCPPACQWCGERGPHHPYCDEPRDLWEADQMSNDCAHLHDAIQHALQQEDN